MHIFVHTRGEYIGYIDHKPRVDRCHRHQDILHTPNVTSCISIWRDVLGLCKTAMRRRVAKHTLDGDGGDDEDSDVIESNGVCVFFYADVTRANNLKLISCLREATVACIRHSTTPDSPPRVYLYIHSNGGDAFAGLAAYDHIRHNPIPVVTVADGMVASAATFMLLAAERRLVHEHAFVRIHQLSITGFDGKYTDLVDEMENSHCLMQKIENLYVCRTGMCRDRCRRLLRQEIDMDATRCLTEGLVHEILYPVEASLSRITSSSLPPRTRRRRGAAVV